MSKTELRLSEVLKGLYPEAAPQSAEALLLSEPYEIRALPLSAEEVEVVLNLRSQFIQAAQAGSESKPVPSALAAFELLSSKDMQVRMNHWVVFVLDNNCYRRRDRRRGYYAAVKSIPSERVPTLTGLGEEGLAKRESDWYLPIFGGDPHRLLPTQEIRWAINSLVTKSQVRDVLFWDSLREGAPVLWTMRGGMGVDASENRYEFRDPTWLTDCGFSIPEPARKEELV